MGIYSGRLLGQAWHSTLGEVSGICLAFLGNQKKRRWREEMIPQAAHDPNKATWRGKGWNGSCWHKEHFQRMWVVHKKNPHRWILEHLKQFYSCTPRGFHGNRRQYSGGEHIILKTIFLPQNPQTFVYLKVRIQVNSLEFVFVRKKKSKAWEAH